MITRREFILGSIAGPGILAFKGRQALAVGELQQTRKTLRILILGGTGFIGPHFVRAALDRGHNISVFTRGKHDTDLPKGVKALIGDRNSDIKSIRNRDWDAVLDLATYVPGWVRSLGEALKGHVGHYTFISTILTYKYPGATHEASAVLAHTGADDPRVSSIVPADKYGPLKVLCEEEAERQFPGKVLVLRPGHIVGPNERAGALTYWVARMAQGGEILSAGDPGMPVQFIDVRDLAEWSVRMVEQTYAGIFNAVGPACLMSWGEMLGALRGAFPAAAELTWVPIPWLLERKVPKFSALLFWPGESGGIPGVFNLNNDKAIAHGLTFRSLNTIILDTWAWYKDLSRDQQTKAVLSVDGRNRALDEGMNRERELLAAWHASSQSKCLSARPE